MPDILAKLERTIAERRGADPASSYVARLSASGGPRIAQKLGEEAVETVIAALSGDDDKIIGEAADLIFHLLILLGEKGLSFSQVLGELERREGISGIAEKAARAGIAP